MDTERLLARIGELSKKGEATLATKLTSQIIGAGAWVAEILFAEFRSSSLSFLKNTFGEKSPFYQEFHQKVDKPKPGNVQCGMGILNAAHTEVKGGWLFTTRGLVSAEVFADFLEMSEHLLGEGYKDPAAVMPGSVLEEHLRQLCESNDIDLEDGKGRFKKANLLNSELTKADVYNKLDQKSITGWLDLRNKAAHGDYEEYTKEQVSLMLQGVTDFMARVRP